MVTLSKDFDFSLGYETDEYYRPKKTYRKLKTPDKPITPKSPAIAYLESRGISKEVAERYEITTQTDHDNVLVFPFYDENGKMQFVKYRKTDFDKTKDKNKEWCEANCKPILFGMKQCVDFKTATICEGMLDSMSVATAGINNAISVPTGAKGFTWVPYCWDWINQFEEIVVFGDYEKGHITLLDELTRRLKIKVKHVREEDYKDCKDANEILQKYGKEQVRKCVENAVLVPMKQVIELADVEDVDIFKIPKLQTGIKQVDKLLYGGLPFGGVVVISAKSGSGKSTLASQILVNAIAQDYICFAYSGELPNYLFKAWLDFQVAGGRHIVEYQNRWGDTQYNVSAANKELIKAWYRGKCYLYDNSAIADDEAEEVSLIKLTENMIMQYGVQVILLDNLMTAIGLESVSGNDKYEKQSEFMKDLSKLALRHNALILLVAHKRKNNFSTNEDDETSGSSDIPNLATITMSYNRDSEIEENQRKLKISKNRLFGKVETNGFIVNYDQKSKRIYGQGDDLYVEYGWRKVETKDDGFVVIDDINLENPFEEG
jgi:archaellum biogenesis ATPase FlaH